MSITYNFGTPGETDFGKFLAQYPDAELPKATRSTVPMLQWWSRGQAALSELCSSIGIERQDTDPAIHFEYPVASIGRAKASFTDVMITWPDDGPVIGIEAKWTESRYQTVGDWLTAGSSEEFRRDVAAHWISLIDGCAGFDGDVDSVLGIPYQVLHRVASVCSLPGSSHHVVYQVFGSDAAPDYYLEDLGAIARLIGTEDVTLGVLSVKTEKKPIVDQLSGSPGDDLSGRSGQIRQAILDSALFEFKKPVWKQ